MKTNWKHFKQLTGVSNSICIIVVTQNGENECVCACVCVCVYVHVAKITSSNDIYLLLVDMEFC